MKMLGDLVIVVKVFVKIDLAVAVQIMQPTNLIPAGNIDLVVDNFQAERLKQSASNAPPFELLQISLDAADEPDIPVPSANRCAPAILEKIETAGSHRCLPRVLVISRERKCVHCKRRVGI